MSFSYYQAFFKKIVDPSEQKSDLDLPSDESRVQESMPKSFDLSSLNKELNESLTTYSSFSEKEIFLILGSAGSGKSTFANYMAGLPMEQKFNKKDGTDYIQTKEGFKPYTTIGHGVATGTLAPQAVPAAYGEKYFYADCPPPYNVSPCCQGNQPKLENTILTQHAIHESKNILGIILCIQLNLLNDKNYISFLPKCLPPLIEHQSSFLFIVRTDELNLKPYHVYNRALENSKILKEAKSLLHFFAEDYSNIHIFNPLDEKDRDVILSKIKKLKPIPKDHFGFPEFNKEHTQLKKSIMSIAEMIDVCKTKDPSGERLQTLFKNPSVQEIYSIAKITHFDSPVVDAFIRLYEEHKTNSKKHKAIPEDVDSHKKPRL